MTSIMQNAAAGSVTFFVPCLNEEGNVGRAIDDIIGVMRERNRTFEVLVVDDASTDKSVAEIEERCRRYPKARIRLIRNPICRGLGANYFLGAEEAEGDYYMMICGDAAELPESIRMILAEVGKAEIIVPYLGMKDTRAKSRRVLSWTFTTLVNLLSGHRLRYYNGPVLHRTQNIRRYPARTSGFGYQAELLCWLLDQGTSYQQIQISNSERESGFSKAFTQRNFVSVGRTLLEIVRRRALRLIGRSALPETTPETSLASSPTPPAADEADSTTHPTQRTS